MNRLILCQICRRKKKRKENILVAGGRHKVKAAVNAVIDNVLAVHATLLVKVGIIPFLNTLQDGLPAGVLLLSNQLFFFFKIMSSN